MKLVYYTPSKLYQDKSILQSNLECFAFSQMFNPTISLIDRTCQILCPPVPIKLLYNLPLWHPTPSFEELCYQRYEEILSNSIYKNNKLVILYSGGIDSTLIVTLSMMHTRFEQDKKNILIAFNDDSIKENPVFWKNFVVSNFGDRLISSSDFYNIVKNDQYVPVTGEFADNIFGSLTVKSYMDNTGDYNALHKNFNETGLIWLLDKIKNKKYHSCCEAMIMNLIRQSPIAISSNHDVFWWLNFILKWQAVKFRLASHAPVPMLVNTMIKRFIHFFDTTEFQNWAVMTQENKLGNDWNTYKLPAKKIIYSFNKDDYYFKWKTKFPSIPSLTRYANMYDFIYYDDCTDQYFPSKTLINDY